MPRVAEMALTSSCVRFRGSAPERIRVARLVASSAVKLPVISPRPPAITELTVGAEMVSPSSRKLKVFRPSSVFFVGSIAPSQPVSKQTTNRQPAISQVKVKALKALSDNGLFIRSILH